MGAGRFEVTRRGAVPVVSGVVVAREHVPLLREALAQDAAADAVRREAQSEARALHLWRALNAALLARRRADLQFEAAYGHAPQEEEQEDGAGGLPEPQAPPPKRRRA